MNLSKLRNGAAKLAGVTGLGIISTFGSATDADADTRVQLIMPDGKCYQTETSVYAGRNVFDIGTRLVTVNADSPSKYINGSTWKKMEKDYNAAIANGTRLPQKAYDLGTSKVAPAWAKSLANGLVKALINDTGAIAGRAYVGGNRISSVTYEARHASDPVGARIKNIGQYFKSCAFLKGATDRPDKNPIDIEYHGGNGKGHNKNLARFAAQLR